MRLARVRATVLEGFLLASRRNGGLRPRAAAVPPRLRGGLRLGMANRLRTRDGLGRRRDDRGRALGRLRPPLAAQRRSVSHGGTDRKSTRLNSSHGYISYAVFCLKK